MPDSDPYFKESPRGPLLDPESVRWICGTLAFIAVLAFAGFVCWVAPDIAKGVLTGLGVLIFWLFMCIFMG